MAEERKRGFPRGDYESTKEAKDLGGLTWQGWKYVLEGHLKDMDFKIPNSDTESLLHEWFVTSRKVKMGELEPTVIDSLRKKLREEHSDIFENPAVIEAFKFITNRVRGS